MKRKDFLTKMRNRRRGDQLELRQPEARRAIDWRTLRVDLPASGEPSDEQSLLPGIVTRLHDGIRLNPTQACWVRGYRVWKTEAGQARAEFQYRPAEDDSKPPPGSVALAAAELWEPTA